MIIKLIFYRIIFHKTNLIIRKHKNKDIKLFIKKLNLSKIY